MQNITVLSRPSRVESKHHQESLVREKESKVKGRTSRNREVKTHVSVTTSALCFNFMVFIIIITILKGKLALQTTAHKQVHKLEKYREEKWL